MGWNDVIGNLRQATKATEQQKKDWAQKVIDGEISLPGSDDDYVKGTVEAAKAYLAGGSTPFKGPEWVVADLEAACS